ncbi:MAG: cytochrome c oxidase subunit II [Chloroflexi bacterium]|nr:cytochrome c oxidase subunit II [Chloroflexota bacterium]
MHRVFKLSFPLRPAIVLLVPVAIALLAACTPDNNQSTFGTAGPIARDQAALFKFIFWIAAVVFVLVEGAVIYASIRFRQRSSSDKLPHQTHGNNKLEITWTIIPALILIAVAVPTLTQIWEQQSGVPDDRGEVLNVEAIGHQWWFEFRYPDHEIITSNELHIPVGRPVSFKLDSQDVIHSFWVPKIAGKVDMVPLNDNYMWMIGDEIGEYYGQCAEFCGIAHAHMRFRVFVHSEEDFQAWADGMHVAADAPAPGSPEASGQQGFNTYCSTCHTNNSTTPGSYAREISFQDARWNGWISDIENAAIVSAPNLTHFGTRTTLAAGLKELNHSTLVDWITDPSSIKIGTRMQEHAAVYNTEDGTADLSPGQVSDIATYLLSLKPGSGSGGGAPATGGGVVDGAEVFATNCSNCHSTTDIKIVGPGLAGIGDRAGSRVPGLGVDEYIKQSLTDPAAYVVDDYPAVMTDWGHLGTETIEALVTYLKTLK